mmetsp:Transcript_37039/g.66674  ORF Transcript_37039/g.66674 Transcript_37039/m.66674 type:complete len:215 (+) Transcript_37039:250-894(+)
MFILNLGPLDFVGRSTEPILGKPFFIHNRNELHLLVIIQSTVHLGNEICHLLLDCVLSSLGFLFGILAQQNNNVGSNLSTSPNTCQLNLGVRNVFELNGSGGDVLALASLENFLRTARDLETAHRINLALVTSAQPAVFSHSLLSGLFVFEVAHHEPWRFHLEFTILRDTLFNSWTGLANSSYFSSARFCHVRIIEVLSHAVSLKQLQSQAVVP